MIRAAVDVLHEAIALALHAYGRRKLGLHVIEARLSDLERRVEGR